MEPLEIERITRRLRVEDVEAAYRRGSFPMAECGLIVWRKPPTRAIIPLDSFHISRSLARTLRRGGFQVTFDRNFDAVMRACADRPSTWIGPEFFTAYSELHRRGKAHSVEVWVEGKLAGGLYGVHLGGAFFAESKFHYVSDMSKVALASLASQLRAREFLLLEVQYLTPHLAQFGAIEIPHSEYARRLETALAAARPFP